MLWQGLENGHSLTLSQRRKLTSAQISFSIVPQHCHNIAVPAGFNVYLRPCQTPMLEFFMETVTYCYRNGPSYVFDSVLNTSLN